MNERVYRRAQVTEESTCRSCPVFAAYMNDSPGFKRGEIGACTWARAEQLPLPPPAPGEFIWMPPCEADNG